MTSRTILVTGSANGMGAAVAALIEAQGHRVIRLDLQEGDVQADLGTADGRQSAVEQVSQSCGGELDGIIACAGIASDDGPLVVSVNYFGTVHLLGGLRPLLAKKSAPRVVTVSSSSVLLEHEKAVVDACLSGDEAAARQASLHATKMVYAATKVALSRWVRRTAILPEWAGAGILLNAVAPGTVLTRITKPILATEEGRARLKQATPIAVSTYATPDEMATVFAFLASPHCNYIVGQTIFVDGGSEVLLRGDAFP